MIAITKSCGVLGIDGFMVDVEVDIAKSLPSFDIVGLPDMAVRESKERVRAAIKNSGFEFPVRKITVNLGPAHIKKEGPSFDLPISIAILTASEQIEFNGIDEYIFLGELSLNGELRPVNGILPIAMEASKKGINRIILPKENADEAAVVKGMEVYPANNLNEIIEHLTGENPISPHTKDINGLFKISPKYEYDFSEVKGQENVKRALEVAAAGGHNLLMIGPPGSGKTMIAKRIPTILPDLTFEEALEVTKIHSVAGLLPSASSIITTRPFRNPHHSVSAAGLIGGGKIPKPGEISLAHFGVLFLDELPEFRKDALEAMRQPIEDGCVTISRINASLTYPSNVMLVASMNPCKCGFYGDNIRECTCSPLQIQQYLSRISGPMLDRIDIHIQVSPVKYKDFETKEQAERSLDIKKRVDKARKIQLKRYKNNNIFNNAQMMPSHIKAFCKLGTEQSTLLKNAFEKLGLSARAYNKILKVARTIADLEGSDDIKTDHITEAIQYRSLDRKFWS